VKKKSVLPPDSFSNEESLPEEWPIRRVLEDLGVKETLPQDIEAVKQKFENWRPPSPDSYAAYLQKN